ncbi:MAG TPA: hypothetical protein VGP72_32070 [Planctomycetota bacterium]|jgi:hypothetical protein
MDLEGNLSREELRSIRYSKTDGKQPQRYIGNLKISQPTIPTMFYFLNLESQRIYAALEPADVQSYRNNPKKYKELSKSEAERQKQHWKNQEAKFASLPQRRLNEVHIFGNGPSINDFAINVNWVGQTTTGVNAAALAVAPLTFWVALDDFTRADRPLYAYMREWYRANSTTLTFTTRSVASRLEKLPDYTFTPGSIGQNGCLYWDGSSVHAALHLALIMRATRIYLWGLDYNRRDHFYTGSTVINHDFGDKPDAVWTDYDRHVAGFAKLKEFAKSIGCDVFNCNPASRLEVFEKVCPEALGLQLNQPLTQPPSQPVEVVVPPPAVSEHPKPKQELVFDLINETIGIDNGSLVNVITFTEAKERDKQLLVGLKAMKRLIKSHQEGS